MNKKLITKTINLTIKGTNFDIRLEPQAKIDDTTRFNIIAKFNYPLILNDIDILNNKFEDVFVKRKIKNFLKRMKFVNSWVE